MKLYVYEAGTERLLKLADRSLGNRLAVLSLASVELRSAIRRRERNGEIPGVAADGLLDAFRRHIEGRFLVQPLTDFLLDAASLLVDRYGLRAYDSLQLAAYFMLRTSSGADEPTFVCADKDLLSAAQSEGAPVLDPALT